MRLSKGLVALLVLAALAAAGLIAYERARPWVHPIKQADARRHGGALEAPRGTPTDPVYMPQDPRGNLFGPARVLDGDTLVIAGVEAHLWTIVAPEAGQADSSRAGEASRANLEKLIAGRTVACRPEGPPEDGRWIGLCFVSDTPCPPQDHGNAGACESDLTSLNLAQVEQGWAEDQEGQYADSEDVARTARRGMWAGRASAD